MVLEDAGSMEDAIGPGQGFLISAVGHNVCEGFRELYHAVAEDEIGGSLFLHPAASTANDWSEMVDIARRVRFTARTIVCCNGKTVAGDTA
jgi:hypothetical protein